MLDQNDEKLFELIHQWQEKPALYVNKLTEQIYDELKLLCKQEAQKDKNQNLNMPASASSLVNEVFIRLSNGHREKKMASVRMFYHYLLNTIANILITREQNNNAQKRRLENIDSQTQEVYDYKMLMNNSTAKGIHSIETLKSCIDKVCVIQKELGEVLLYKYFSARTNNEIARIMEFSPKTIESYHTQGKKILTAVANGLETAA